MKTATFAERLAEAMKIREVSQTELHNRTGINKSSISTYLKGEYEAKQNKVYEIARALNVSEAWLMGYDVDMTPTPAPQPKRKYVKIPVLGRVVAGVPSEAVENVLDYEEIPEEMARGGEYFGLEVYGDSMEPTLQEGDVVIVKKQYEARPHDIAVVMVNGDEATIKEVKISEDGITLIGHNVNSYTPRFYSAREAAALPVKIIGVVWEIRRKLRVYYGQ